MARGRGRGGAGNSRMKRRAGEGFGTVVENETWWGSGASFARGSFIKKDKTTRRKP